MSERARELATMHLRKAVRFYRYARQLARSPQLGPGFVLEAVARAERHLRQRALFTGPQAEVHAWLRPRGTDACERRALALGTLSPEERMRLEDGLAVAEPGAGHALLREAYRRAGFGGVR